MDFDFTPNVDDEYGEYWDPWKALGLECASYNGQVCRDAINVLKGIREDKFMTEIAKDADLSETHVELLQYIFCSADWCDYGTSPRGCFFTDEVLGDRLIEKWEKYYARVWDREDPQ